jgi:hypothetical protein
VLDDQDLPPTPLHVSARGRDALDSEEATHIILNKLNSLINKHFQYNFEFIKLKLKF